MPETVSKLLMTGDALAIFLLSLTFAVLLLLTFCMVLALRLTRISKQLKSLNRGIDGGNLIEVLTNHMDTVESTVKRMDALEEAVGVLQAQIPGCLQRVHMLRYNAFEDVGGDQSFAVALLNGRGDGVLLTSVCSRNDIRVYSKSISKGQASHPLSREEERVLRESVAR